MFFFCKKAHEYWAVSGITLIYWGKKALVLSQKLKISLKITTLDCDQGHTFTRGSLAEKNGSRGECLHARLCVWMEARCCEGAAELKGFVSSRTGTTRRPRAASFRGPPAPERGAPRQGCREGAPRHRAPPCRLPPAP